ncbi:flavodoxin family protein [Streptomyces alanosinicus]|uniref:Flavodoxin n=1 Tax=Streptomyces alanosinicus TaxID=68171 RepID=A0A919D0N4_9ACTN|nr:flavodoxin family protein [Streptomyces alanosinicus]GHE01547.1 flavodoxin [Streptomyces alanosinicus]
MTRTLIICTSVSHGNTRRVAEAMAEVLGAKVVEPDQVELAELGDYDLIGFGSGIFNRRFHPDLLRFVSALPGAHGSAFVFATSGLPGVRFEPLLRALQDKGFKTAGTFSCRAFDTWAPFKPVGGIRKGRPDRSDLQAARQFAEGLRGR